MIFKIRVGFCDYEEVDLTEEKAADFLDFLINGDRGYNPCGSLFANNQALVAMLKSGQPLSCDFYDKYRNNLMLQK